MPIVGDQKWEMRLYPGWTKKWRKAGEIWVISGIALLWSLWLARNDAIFNSRRTKGWKVFEKSQLRAYEWVLIRGKQMRCPVDKWLENSFNMSKHSMDKHISMVQQLGTMQRLEERTKEDSPTISGAGDGSENTKNEEVAGQRLERWRWLDMSSSALTPEFTLCLFRPYSYVNLLFDMMWVDLNVSVFLAKMELG
ncbi:hypothetical protein Ancab_005020 [Ancistrocladus abbreviatus]